MGTLLHIPDLMPSHERQKLEGDFEQALPDEEDDDEAFVS